MAPLRSLPAGEDLKLSLTDREDERITLEWGYINARLHCVSVTATHVTAN